MSSKLCQFPDLIGVCNGRMADNLPSEREVVELYKSNGIKLMRIYDPNQATLTALQGSDIQLILDVPNVDLQSLQSESNAIDWVETNVLQAIKLIRYIAVGNEVDPEKQETSHFVPLVLPAMRNVHKALSDLGLQDEIKVSTATYSALLKDTTPPSHAKFKDPSFMEPIIHFLAQTGTPLLANIFPYFAYVEDTSGAVDLDFALGTSSKVAFVDRDLEYRNLFDAMVDGVYYALEKAGGQNVGVVISESGWPSAGDGEAESLANANAYYQCLMNHVADGTPKKRGKALETYLFAMFDENEKPGKKNIVQHFGLFYPDKTPKYHLP